MKENKTLKKINPVLEGLLKGNLPVKILSFCVKESGTSMKYHFDELVDYNGEFLNVDETIKRFKEEHPFYTLLCVDIMNKTIMNIEEKQYKWDIKKIM